MKITLVTTGNKMPAWVEQASQDFIKRLPPEIKIEIKLLPLIKRGKNPDIPRIVRDESIKMLAAVPERAKLLVLDVKGKAISTEDLAEKLDGWMAEGDDLAIIIGGPDGISNEIIKTGERISLSKMTFPHPLVKVVLLEQIYRAWSINANHPYHRA